MNDIAEIAEMTDVDLMNRLQESEDEVKSIFFTEAARYNVQDVRILVELEAMRQIINLAMVIAYTACVNFEDVISNMRVIDNMIYRYLRNKDILFRTKKVRSPRREFEGAFVKPPITGRHRWVVSFDVTSEYPSIMIAQNMSPETKVGRVSASVDQILAKKLECDLKTDDVALCANGVTFRRDRQGVMPEILTYLFDSRSRYKTMAKDAKKAGQKADAVKYDLMQMTFKIILNSIYGVSGNEEFRFYDADIAEGVTATGQALIQWVAHDINRGLQSVMGDTKDRIVAVDTDSNYVDLSDIVAKKFAKQGKASDDEVLEFLYDYCDVKMQTLIDKSFENFASYINSYQPKRYSMKREAISNSSIFVAKKRYLMSVLDVEGFKKHDTKIMGLDAVRSTTPSIFRSKMKEIYEIMLHGEEEDFQTFIVKLQNEAKSAPIGQIAFNAGVSNVSKFIKGDGVASGTPIYSRAAINYNKLLEQRDLTHMYPRIREGDKVKYVYLVNPNPLHENVIAWSDELPAEFGLEPYIDFDLQIEKGFLNAIEKISDVIGWSIEDKPQLMF